MLVTVRDPSLRCGTPDPHAAVPGLIELARWTAERSSTFRSYPAQICFTCEDDPTRKDAPTMNRTGANPANTRDWSPDAYSRTKLGLESDLGTSHGCSRASNEPEPTPVSG